MSRPGRRFAAYAALFLVPWSLVDAGGVLTFVFPFGLLNFDPLYVSDVVSFATVNTEYLPRYLLSWPIGVGLYALAILSLLSGLVFDREDRRVTAGLVVLAGLTQLSMVYGFVRSPGATAMPLGAVLCWAVVWWFDWPAIRETLTVPG
jgi:uncharacterized protein (TIGR04206 family)